MSDLPLADHLYDRALDLARERAAQWRASERDAGRELEIMAETGGSQGTDALRVARDRLAEVLMSDAEADPEIVLAHRLIQLALAPGESFG